MIHEMENGWINTHLWSTGWGLLSDFPPFWGLDDCRFHLFSKGWFRGKWSIL